GAPACANPEAHHRRGRRGLGSGEGTRKRSGPRATSEAVGPTGPAAAAEEESTRKRSAGRRAWYGEVRRLLPLRAAERLLRHETAAAVGILYALHATSASMNWSAASITGT